MCVLCLMLFKVSLVLVVWMFGLVWCMLFSGRLMLVISEVLCVLWLLCMLIC